MALCLASGLALAQGSGTVIAEPPLAYYLPADFEWPTGLFKTVLVTGRGATPELARADAFKTAVEQAAGVEVTAAVQATNQRWVSIQTTTYSQARVSNFAIVSTQIKDGVWQCQMWATVRGLS